MALSRTSPGARLGLRSVLQRRPGPGSEPHAGQHMRDAQSTGPTKVMGNALSSSTDLRAYDWKPEKRNSLVKVTKSL